MKIFVALLVVMVVVAEARPDVFEYEGDNHEHEQDGTPGQAVQGEYSWTSPEGQDFSISYVADEKGYRVSGNAVPEDHDGNGADGQYVD